jgi:hypothetical protein
LDCKQRSHRSFVQIAFGLTCLLGLTVSAIAQQGAKPTTEKWRPKDGVYARPGAHFHDRCLNRTEVFVELANKSIGGDEYNCKISKLSDTGPGAIQLEATCSDVAKERPSREVISLNKIDEKTIFYRGTTDGKDKDAGVRYSYCPEDVQRLDIEAKKKSD